MDARAWHARGMYFTHDLANLKINNDIKFLLDLPELPSCTVQATGFIEGILQWFLDTY